MSLKIEYPRVFWDSLLPKKAMMCAELYCQIWKEPPWLEDFWESSSVLKDMEVQLKKNGAICIFAEIDACQVVGFTWGYFISQFDMTSICGNNKLDFVFNGKKVFYVDELGVNSLYRNHGIGKHLTKKLLNSAEEDGAKTVILRTNILASSARTVYKEEGFIDLDICDEKYPDRTYWSLNLS